MTIVMTETWSGPRHDGRMWPAAGEPFDVDDDEGRALVAHGYAAAAGAPKRGPGRPRKDTTVTAVAVAEDSEYED